MVNVYNLYNLEASFRQFMLAGNFKPISIRNYLSDFRHFSGWLLSKDSHGLKSGFSQIAEINLQEILTIETITNYKNYLITCKLPVKTINRRLSTMRKFCSFCISQGWLHENPAKKVGNVIRQRNPYREEVRKDVNDTNTILSTFQQHLINEDNDTQTIKSYLDDVRELLQI